MSGETSLAGVTRTFVIETRATPLSIAPVMRLLRGLAKIGDRSDWLGQVAREQLDFGLHHLTQSLLDSVQMFDLPALAPISVLLAYLESLDSSRHQRAMELLRAYVDQAAPDTRP
jgi:hypothetical protein